MVPVNKINFTEK